MKIQAIVKEYREKAGLTQEQVAQALYVQRSTYTHYENGRRKIDADTFFRLMDIFGMKLSIQEKKSFQWRLDYEELSDEKEPIVLVVYDNQDTYRVDGFLWDGYEKQDLLFTGSSDLEQGIWFGKEDIDGILQYEWKDRYSVVDVEVVTLDNITLPAIEERPKGKRFTHTLSITQIEWWIRRAVKEQFGLAFDYTFYMEPDDDYASCTIGEDEESKQALYEVFKSTQPEHMSDVGVDANRLSEELEAFIYDSEPNLTDAILGSLFGGKVLHYRMDSTHYDKIIVTCRA